MQETSDAELLRQFAEQSSETAFAALVTRHVNLVYSAALRKTGNGAAAEEITQAVFIILARKARGLRPETILSGWLYQAVRLTAANFLRTEIRRARREQEAFMQSLSHEPDPEVWRQIKPLLEDAMGQLNETERDAVVLRYFEEKSFQEIGTLAGASENAVKKRVGRALEKLNHYFGRRGISSTTHIIAGAISAHSVQVAPAALAKTVTALAVAKGAAASTSTLALIKGALKLMAWTKAKTAVIAGIGILLAAGTATVAVKELSAPPASYLRIEGKGQIELTSGSNQLRVVESCHLVVLTDGKLYHISIESKAEGSLLTNNIYDVTAEYGCDGQDIFVLSDRLSAVHQTRAGFGGFAYSGRFPYMDEVAPSVVHAAWLGYCSGDYFNISSHQTGFDLGRNFSSVWPEYITNWPTFWPDSTLPQSITGWSRNWWILDRTNSLQPMQAVELEQYPSGFKAWKFTASDPVTVKTTRMPRQLTLETFLPKPSNTATTGDETILLRRATFTADSIETVKGRLNPLPPVPVPDLEVMDSRFKDVAGNFVITSHATPKGWPTRGSDAYNKAAAKAGSLGSQNRALIESDNKRASEIIPPPN